MLNGSSKRFLALIFTVLLGAAALAGCGSNNNNKSIAIGSPAAGGATNTQVTTGKVGSTAETQDPNDSNKDTNKISKEPPPVQILTGNYTGIYVSKPTIRIVQSNKDRKALLNEHFSHGVQREPVAATTFTDRQLVGLFFPKSKKGTVVVITDVHQEGDHVVVTAVELTNGQGCKNKGPAPRPFHIVETRKMQVTGKPVLRLNKQQASPCT